MAGEEVQPEREQRLALAGPSLCGIKEIAIQPFADDEHFIRVKPAERGQLLTCLEDSKGKRRQEAFVWKVPERGMCDEGRPDLLAH